MSATVTELRPGVRLVSAETGAILPDGPPAAPAARVRLRPLARLDVEQARQFLMELDGRMAGADVSRLAYLVGLLEGHAASLMDVIDAVTEV
jgi:hypothetical protein